MLIELCSKFPSILWVEFNNCNNYILITLGNDSEKDKIIKEYNKLKLDNYRLEVR